MQTGIGSVAVKVPRVSDRGGEDGERIRFSSNVLPKYLRRSKSVEELMPWLYLIDGNGAVIEYVIYELDGREEYVIKAGALDHDDVAMVTAWCEGWIDGRFDHGYEIVKRCYDEGKGLLELRVLPAGREPLAWAASVQLCLSTSV